MEKFDEHVKGAKQVYNPDSQFVTTTMQKIEAIGVPKRRWLNWKVLTPMAGTLAAVVVAIILFTPHFNGVTTDATTPGDTQKGTNVQTQTAVSTPINPTDTSDAALNSDLGSIQASLTQSSNDQSAADNSINDNQQQITIPTE